MQRNRCLENGVAALRKTVADWRRPFLEMDERARINKLHDEAVEFEKHARQMCLFGENDD